MLRLAGPALLAPAFLVLVALAPLAAAEGEPPCDGEPLVEVQDPLGFTGPQDQVRALAIACAFGGDALVAACTDAGEVLAFAAQWTGFYVESLWSVVAGAGLPGGPIGNPVPTGSPC